MHFIPDVVSVGVDALSERDGVVRVEELVEEAAARQPHPHARVRAPVGVQQQLVEDLHTIRVLDHSMFFSEMCRKEHKNKLLNTFVFFYTL